VLHHLAALGIDPERDDYTMAGIGDMSGDVFGNGLLLARRARLLAAFDHRHVFLDPDPDPDTAFAERRRLFELDSSCWADYDPAKISPGGGVFARCAKRIALSPRRREGLGIEAEAASGADVVRALLAMPVDLLWNGGIGTYVKASDETQADAGDRANDAVRIDASALRARVIGEGGNLGLTPAARVEAALRGVRLDTDAIDNSAGVDLSDHEVNYKILLAPLVRSGFHSASDRRAALFSVADAACQHVLDHNRGQALALSLDEIRSQRDLPAFSRAIDRWCEPPQVERAELELPCPETLAERQDQGLGLTRPEIAMLLGLAKLETRQAFAASPLSDLDYLLPLYRDYFPEPFQRQYAQGLGQHRLRREITALQVTNRLLDTGGVTLLPTLCSELGVELPEALAAVLLAEDLTEATDLRAQLLGTATLPLETVFSALLAIDRSVRDVARYLILGGELELDRERMEQRRAGLRALRDQLSEFLSEGETRQIHERRDDLAGSGLPALLAEPLAVLPLADRGLNILRIAEHTGVTPIAAARLYARIGDATGINWVYGRLPVVETEDVWDSMILVEMRWTLLDLQRELSERLLRESPGDPDRAAEAFVASHAAQLERVRALQQRAISSGRVSSLAVVTRSLGRLRAPG
jgi:glutamate dehydrogenase